MRVREGRGGLTEKTEEKESGREIFSDWGPWISAGAHFHHLDGSDLHGTRRKEVFLLPRDAEIFDRSLQMFCTPNPEV